MYLVTELAQYSLKDVFAILREKNSSLSSEEVKTFCKAILVAAASLHAKGFVHLDLKPENLMMFGGKLKVIDVDGCVKMNTKVSIQDRSISFSPYYCAPEWARFLACESETDILALPGLDAWSVGMTLCELITHEAILKPQYCDFRRGAPSHREAGVLLIEWLASITSAPVPREVEEHDQVFLDLLSNWLLVCGQGERKSCAECLAHEFIADAGWNLEAAELRHMGRQSQQEEPPTGTPPHKGEVAKLKAAGNASKAPQWVRCGLRKVAAWRSLVPKGKPTLCRC